MVPNGWGERSSSPPTYRLRKVRKLFPLGTDEKLILDLLGLTNGVKGTIDSIFYPADATPNAPGNGRAANLPLAVLVHFPGYTGPTEWYNNEGEKLVPIAPTTASWQGPHRITCTRKQLPLRLAYGITVHKSQGLTLDRAVIHLGDKDFQRGLSFVACSRVRSLKALAFSERFPASRLTNLGKSAKGDVADSPWTTDVERREALGFQVPAEAYNMGYVFKEDE